MCVGEDRRTWKGVFPSLEPVAAHIESPPFARAPTSASASFLHSIPPPSLSTSLLGLWFSVLFHKKHLPERHTHTHTHTSPLPSTRLPTCLCNSECLLEHFARGSRGSRAQRVYRMNFDCYVGFMMELTCKRAGDV